MIITGSSASLPRSGLENSHDVVVVARQYGDTLPTLPVPDPNGLIIRSREDPRVLVVEVDGADVVEVTVEGEETATGLVAVGRRER